MVAHTSNPGTWEVRAGVAEIQGDLQLQKASGSLGIQKYLLNTGTHAKLQFIILFSEGFYF